MIRPVIAAAVALISGCAVAPSQQDAIWIPSSATLTGEMIEGTLSPSCDPYQCKGFRVQLVNKTSKPVEIDWNKSYYIKNGQTNGGLMTEGVVFSQRNEVRPPDMILASGRYDKLLWPSNNMSFYAGTSSLGWVNHGLYTGEHGIFLTVRQGGKEEQITAQMKLISHQVDPDASAEYAPTPFIKLPSIKIGDINIMNGDK